MTDPLAKLRKARAIRLAEGLPTSRSCEGCDLCCTAPGIAIREFHKPPGVPCKYLSGEPGHSCSIYDRRPKVCAGFYCLWRMADTILPAWQRPVDAGFVVALNDPYTWPGVVTIHPDPARPKAWDTLWHTTVFGHLATRWNCIVAIGQAEICTDLFYPNGTRVSRQDHPDLFTDHDGKVGAPDTVFGPDQRPLVEQMHETIFQWSIAPP